MEHNLQLNGVQAFILSVEEEGHKITVSGWYHKCHTFKKGDKAILNKPNMSTRYKIVKVKLPGDPPDQYFITCEFDPR